jgi:hypothetical protein
MLEEWNPNTLEEREYWNAGIMEEWVKIKHKIKTVSLFAFFDSSYLFFFPQYSSIPTFQSSNVSFVAKSLWFGR